ncbi:hypothetical protein JCM17961_23590 [Endothiovibrio diazotrophicus]
MQGLGALTFLLGTLWAGARIRRDASRASAERLSRVSHALFWGGLVLPEAVGLVHPGLRAFDPLLGLPPLPYPELAAVLGWPLFVAGLYYLAASNVALKAKGAGFAAFKLTRRVVSLSVYQQVRNPMSLGTYLAYLGIALIAGSSYLLLGALLVVIPVHAFNLCFFEERELLARYGEAYAHYVARVPFLVPSPGRSLWRSPR